MTTYNKVSLINNKYELTGTYAVTTDKTSYNAGGAAIHNRNNGGGPYSGTGGVLRINGSTLSNNELDNQLILNVSGLNTSSINANVYGGAIWDNGNGDIILNGAKIENNKVENNSKISVVNNSALNSVNAGGSGSAIYTNTISLEIKNGTIIKNNKGINNSQITQDGGSTIGTKWLSHNGTIAVNNSDVLIDGATISHNEVDYGGGIHSGSNSYITINDATISNNKATGSGGGIYVFGRLILNDILLEKNTAKTYGGGIMVKGTTILNGGTIINNETEQYSGGGIRIDGDFTMNGGIITENSSFQNGGGIDIDANRPFIMRGGTIANNTANGLGAGIYNNGDLKISGTSLVNSNNDIYLVNNRFITVDGTLNNDNVGIITPNAYVLNRLLVENVTNENIQHKFTLTPSAGFFIGVENKNLIITDSDTISPKINILYSVIEPTLGNVTVTMVANEEIQTVPGWSLATNKLELSKTYTQNVNENVIVKDLAGNSTNVNIKIENIATEVLTSTIYTITTDNYITSILPNTTLTKLLQSLNSLFSIKVYAVDGSEITGQTLIGTGMKLIVNETEYILVVKGDVNGTGVVDLNDAIKVLQHRAGGSNPQLIGPYLKAAQLTTEGQVSLNDVIKIMKYKATNGVEPL